jgi:hypothetical protein
MSIKMRIKVTKKILEKSRYCGFRTFPTVENCAIALAVRNIFPEATVNADSIAPFGEPRRGIIMLPNDAQIFMAKFDSSNWEERLSLPEMEFEIAIADNIIAQIGNGNIEEVKTIIQNSETLELV